MFSYVPRFEDPEEFSHAAARRRNAFGLFAFSLRRCAAA